MSEDRTAVLERRLADVERDLAELRAVVRGSVPTPADANDPLRDHPLIWKKPPREVLEQWEAQRLKELGIDHLQPVGAKRLREMMIAAGVDPNSNEFSRGIIEMREE